MSVSSTSRSSNYAWLYRTATWHKLRRHQLRSEPLCRYCRELGRLTPATVADHVIPHRGDLVLFYDPANLQSLCKTCHDHVKQRLERTGRRAGTRLDGTPVDPSHPWSRELSAARDGPPGGEEG